MIQLDDVNQVKIVTICAIIAFALCVNMFSFVNAQGTIIAIDPSLYSTTQAQIGQPFTLNINITNVANLWSWGVRLNWNPDVVNATSVQEGPFLKSAGNALFLPPTRGTGYLKDLGSTLLTSSTANGSGILCIVTFQALAVGQTGITLNETSLLRFDETTIPATVSNGTVIVTVPEIPSSLLFVVIFAAAVSVVILVKKKTKVGATGLRTNRKLST